MDDWEDGQPDAWDYEAVLKENGVTVERCDALIDGNGNEYRAGEFAGWGFYWKHGAIHIGQTSETIARKAAALFVSLWLRGVSASFCDKIMSGMIWFWELQDRPGGSIRAPLDLAKLFHETYERLAPTSATRRGQSPATSGPKRPMAACDRRRGEVVKHILSAC